MRIEMFFPTPTEIVPSLITLTLQSELIGEGNNKTKPTVLLDLVLACLVKFKL